MKRWGQNSALQKIETTPIKLVTVSTSSAVPSDPDVYFAVPVPDSRLRVKISVLYIPAAGAAFEFNMTTSAGIWLSEIELDRSGVSGRRIPCTNIEGTEAAPTAVPLTNPLLGYSREFVTAADEIQGKFTMLANVALGTWVLQTRYQPESVRFTDQEWDEIATACQPSVFKGPLSF